MQKIYLKIKPIFLTLAVLFFASSLTLDVFRPSEGFNNHAPLKLNFSLASKHDFNILSWHLTSAEEIKAKLQALRPKYRTLGDDDFAHFQDEIVQEVQRRQKTEFFQQNTAMCSSVAVAKKAFFIVHNPSSKIKDIISQDWKCITLSSKALILVRKDAKLKFKQPKAYVEDGFYTIEAYGLKDGDGKQNFLFNLVMVNLDWRNKKNKKVDKTEKKVTKKIRKILDKVDEHKKTLIIGSFRLDSKFNKKSFKKMVAMAKAKRLDVAGSESTRELNFIAPSGSDGSRDLIYNYCFYSKNPEEDEAYPKVEILAHRYRPTLAVNKFLKDKITERYAPSLWGRGASWWQRFSGVLPFLRRGPDRAPSPAVLTSGDGRWPLPVVPAPLPPTLPRPILAPAARPAVPPAASPRKASPAPDRRARPPKIAKPAVQADDDGDSDAAGTEDDLPAPVRAPAPSLRPPLEPRAPVRVPRVSAPLRPPSAPAPRVELPRAPAPVLRPPAARAVAVPARPPLPQPKTLSRHPYKSRLFIGKDFGDSKLILTQSHFKPTSVHTTEDGYVVDFGIIFLNGESEDSFIKKNLQQRINHLDQVKHLDKSFWDLAGVSPAEVAAIRAVAQKERVAFRFNKNSNTSFQWWEQRALKSAFDRKKPTVRPSGDSTFTILYGADIQTLVRDNPGKFTALTGIQLASNRFTHEGKLEGCPGKPNINMSGYQLKGVQGETVATMMLAVSIYRKWILELVLKTLGIFPNGIYLTDGGRPRDQEDPESAQIAFQGSSKILFTARQNAHGDDRPSVGDANKYTRNFAPLWWSDIQSSCCQLISYGINMRARSTDAPVVRQNKAKSMLKVQMVGAVRMAFIKGLKTIFLTPLGMGAFRNEVAWFQEALREALQEVKDLGLEIYMVLKEGDKKRRADYENASPTNIFKACQEAARTAGYPKKEQFFDFDLNHARLCKIGS